MALWFQPIRHLSSFKPAPSSFLNKARLDVLGANRDRVVVSFALFAPQSSVHDTLHSWLVRLFLTLLSPLFLSHSVSPPSLPLGFSPDDAALSGISPETDAARGHGVLLRATHATALYLFPPFCKRTRRHLAQHTPSTMSTKENNEVVIEKVSENDKTSGDAKCEIKGIKRPAEVSSVLFFPSIFRRDFFFYHLYYQFPRLVRKANITCRLETRTTYTPAYYTMLPRHAARSRHRLWFHGIIAIIIQRQ